MPLNLFYTMVQKKSKMTKNSNQGGPALNPRTLREFPLLSQELFATGLTSSKAGSRLSVWGGSLTDVRITMSLWRGQTQTQTQTYLFWQDCRKSKVHYLSRLRSCEE